MKSFWRKRYMQIQNELNCRLLFHLLQRSFDPPFVAMFFIPGIGMDIDTCTTCILPYMYSQSYS